MEEVQLCNGCRYLGLLDLLGYYLESFVTDTFNFAKYPETEVVAVLAEQ